jgi:hypothetical protein
MSPYERGPRGNALGGDGNHVSPTEVTPKWAKGLRTLGGFLASVGGRLDKTGVTPHAGRETRPGVNQGSKGRIRTSVLNLSPLGRPTEDSRGFKPDPGNLAVRDYRGASGNVAMVGLRTQLAIERAGLEIPHLKRGAPDFYPSGAGHPRRAGVNGQPEELRNSAEAGRLPRGGTSRMNREVHVRNL